MRAQLYNHFFFLIYCLVFAVIQGLLYLLVINLDGIKLTHSKQIALNSSHICSIDESGEYLLRNVLVKLLIKSFKSFMWTFDHSNCFLSAGGV